MKMRIIVHFGMYKTGSTSIQETLYKNRSSLNKVCYPDFGTPAHNGILDTVFRAKPKRTDEASIRSFEANKERLLSELKAKISSATEPNIIISAEVISSFDFEQLRSFYSLLSIYTNEIIAVGYIRPPKAYIESAFQQTMKGGRVKYFNLEQRIPRYQTDFEKFDQIFGKENVHFWKFEPSSFPDGCVVRHFCQQLNIDISPDAIVRLNESLSLNATSLLYAYSKYGQGFGGSPDERKKARLLVDLMTQLPGKKLRFASELIGPLLEANSQQTEWMEMRMGASLAEDISKDDQNAIHSEDELLSFAPEALQWLAEQLGNDFVNRWRPQMKPQQVAKWIHRLYLKLSADKKAVTKATNNLPSNDQKNYPEGVKVNPYQNLPSEAFWRTAVADNEPCQIKNIWQPKFQVNRQQKIATAGSCFAQHISKALLARGYSWFDGEPAPQGLALASQQAFNYGIFSFRTGNIYTAALLKQWIKWALVGEPVPCEVWERNGRFYDPFRPNIEPDGFSSIEEMQASRRNTLDAIRNVFTQTKLFVFTLGLTEAWLNIQQNYVYPMCPGTVAGEFDAEKHKFINYNYQQILGDLRESFNLIKKHNPSIKFLLTVSPVPLTATAAKHHVLVATTYSKSTLRAVAGDLAALRNDVDYFPSYELITSFPFRGIFFKDNLRSVTSEGVDFVMNSFFSCLGDGNNTNKVSEVSVTSGSNSSRNSDNDDEQDDVVCEEKLLAAFGAEQPI